MQPIASGSMAFQGDQSVTFEIEYYDTPFLVLEGTGDRAASNGMLFDVRQAYRQQDWDLADQLEAATAATALTTFQTHATSRALVTDGALGNAIEYWAGGAPGWVGATERGRVAYHLRAYLRPAAQRAWFNGNATATVTLAVGCNGYVRADKNGTTTLLNQEFTERDYLHGGADTRGGLLLSSAFTLSDGDYLDLYYVQRDHDTWGGFVFKLISGDVGALTLRKVREEVIREAPVLGCGLMDAGTAVTPRTVRFARELTVTREKQKAATATFELPLLNPAVHDGTGWEWQRAAGNPDDPGRLRLHQGADPALAYDLRRQRLCRIKLGFADEPLWTVFTGFIHDFTGLSDGQVQVSCVSAEQRLLERFDKNFPDKIDYMTRNYRRRLGATQPVYELPALDNWPLEYAIACMAIRAGVDASAMARAQTVPLASGGAATVTLGTQLFRKFRARAMNGKPIRLERPVHYGNYGQAFKEQKPLDDEYVFKPEVTRELWHRIREICDNYGYDVGFDELGDLVLRTTNNPCWVYNLDPGETTGGVRDIAVNAYGGTICHFASGGSVTKTVTGARIDVAVGLFDGGGAWDYTVTRVADSAVVASGTILTQADTETYFYDYRAATDGINQTVTTVYTGDFGQYTVALTSASNTRLDALFVYHTDPETPRLPVLNTTANALQVTAKDQLGEMRNFVIVVGRRRATVTDSEKLATNPNNPEAEFVVAAAVDVESIVDPTALHYIGQVKETIIYSTGITDDDFAEYVARVFIYRYRNPKPGATITHTMLPCVQLGDPLYVRDDRYQTITEAWPVWVTKLEHTVRDGRYLTQLETESFPDYPSYEPRVDIDIDQDFHGKPAANVLVQYSSLTGHTQTNLEQTVVRVSPDTPYDSVDRPGDIVELTGLTLTGSTLDLSGQPWPPVPGTIQIRPATAGTTSGTEVFKDDAIQRVKIAQGGMIESTYVMENFHEEVEIRITTRPVLYGSLFGILDNVVLGRSSSAATQGFRYELAGTAQTKKLRIIRDKLYAVGGDLYVWVDIRWIQAGQGSAPRWLTNTPYHRYFTVDYTAQTLDLVWEHGDPGHASYQRNPALTTFDVRYRQLPTDYAGGNSPFFDVTTSELGYLVKVQADFLISGLYRVSVRSLHDDTVLCYLTEPTTESSDPEAHWQWFTAGAERVFYTDMVDAVGAWNYTQSEDYANAAMGSFEQQEKPKIGKGFLAWNREWEAGARAPLALICGSLEADGSPTWQAGAVDTYAGWYVLIEAQNDELEERWIDQQDNVRAGQSADGDTLQYALPRTVDSRVLVAANQENLVGSTTQALIFTHLPAPTCVEILPSDWKSATLFDMDDTDAVDLESNWLASTATTDADYGWINNYKPLRLRFQIVPRPGILWAGREQEASVRLVRHAHLKFLWHEQGTAFDGVMYPASTSEVKNLYSRRLYNDTHTIVFPDATYRKGETFKSASNLDGIEWLFTPNQFVKDWGDGREEPLEFGNPLQLEDIPKWDASRQVGGMRGRSHLGFVAYLWYLSVYTQDRSGRFCWTINPDFVDRSKIVTNTTPITWPEDLQRMQRRTIVCRQWRGERMDEYRTWKEHQTLKWGLSGTVGETLLEHQWADHDPTSATLGGAAWPTLGTDQYSTNDAARLTKLGFTGDVLQRQLRPGDLGLWTFETRPTWYPCLTRDFYPYWLIPPMVEHEYVTNHQGMASLSAVDDKTIANHDVQNAADGALYISADETKTESFSGSVINHNKNNDPAKFTIWSSALYDMTEASADKVRWWPGFRIARDSLPVSKFGNTIPENALEYTRVDDTQHYEEFRGMWSRGPREAEQPRKVTPIGPYFVNQFRYAWFEVYTALRNIAYGNWRALPTNHFSVHMRGEYVWESGTMFPADQYGVELLDYYNEAKCRFPLTPQGNASLRYDYGGWVGWKDDLPAGAPVKVIAHNANLDIGAFDLGKMPCGVGVSVPSDQEVYFHLVLLNERRETPIEPNVVPATVGAPDTAVWLGPAIPLVPSESAEARVQLFDASGRENRRTRIELSVDDPAVVEAQEVAPGMVVLRGRTAGTTTVRARAGTVTATLSVTVS